MILQGFSIYLMETLKHWLSLHGSIVVFMFLTTVGKGSACEAPSSPECFRRNADESVYICEWSMNMTRESDVTFDLYFNETKSGSFKETSCEFNEEQLIKHRLVYIWVKARAGNSSCTSNRTSAVLADTVKYEAPKNIFMSWIKNNLNLKWTAAEKHPASAEVRSRRHEHPNDSWETRLSTTNITDRTSVYEVSLLKNSAYEVQIRHKSTKARNPLWSDWSPVVIVPAELEEKPEVTKTITLVNGTRKVTLTWKPMQRAASVTGVDYSVKDTQSAHGCPCVKKRHDIKMNKYTTYISYSAVNISVVAKNRAGFSPPAIIQIPAEPAADLKTCDKTLLKEKLNKKTCLEWYEIQDGDTRPENVNTLTARMKKNEREQMRNNTKNFVRYLYFEHRCDGGKPQTVKMCLFYQEQAAPLMEPLDFTAFGETHSSANLSWKAIPSVALRGFLTHYRLCSVNISSQDEHTECHNISASQLKYHLKNLTPAAKYNISLAAVTGGGEGPHAIVIINMLPEKPMNVWWSLGLLFVFFLISTMCTFVLKRIKNKILPPVPTPVIQDFTSYSPTETQEMLERKEEVHELTLHQLHPEGKSVPEDAEEATALGGEWDNGTDEDVENERGESRMFGGSSNESMDSTDQALRSSREGEMTDLDQVDNEIAMLIYRNGLVFDVKTDSP